MKKIAFAVLAALSFAASFAHAASRDPIQFPRTGDTYFGV